jgi:hypothetical protein
MPPQHPVLPLSERVRAGEQPSSDCLREDELADQLRVGAVRVLQPADMPLGERIATIADPDGNPAAALQRVQPIALMTGGGYLSL